MAAGEISHRAAKLAKEERAIEKTPLQAVVVFNPAES
jgi:hypothetical protein